MWLNCKTIKKWHPLYFYINPPFSSLSPLSSKKFCTPPPKWLNFQRVLPPPPFNKRWGGSNYGSNIGLCCCKSFFGIKFCFFVCCFFFFNTTLIVSWFLFKCAIPTKVKWNHVYPSFPEMVTASWILLFCFQLIIANMQRGFFTNSTGNLLSTLGFLGSYIIFVVL